MTANPQYRVFIDRNFGSIHGALTMQRAVGPDIEYVVKQIPITTGQYPYTGGGTDDWVTGKGSTPMGIHWLSTRREKLQMTPGGPFYCLSTEIGGRILKGPNGKVRVNAGLHYENNFPGTAGCTALVIDTPARKAEADVFFGKLDQLYAQGIRQIRCVVL